MAPIEPTAKKLMVVACFAPPIIFTTENVEDLDPRIQQMIKDQDGLKCGTDGVPGTHCIRRCIWCSVSEFGKNG